MISVCPWVYPHLILNGFALKWLWTVKFKIGISMRALMTLHICFSFTVFLNDCQYLVHYQILWKKFPYCNIRLYNSLEVASHNKHPTKKCRFSNRSVCVPTTYVLNCAVYQAVCLQEGLSRNRLIWDCIFVTFYHAWLFI